MRVLIAEDETMNRRLLEVNVSKWGHEPVLADNGEQAWELLQGPDAPSIVLLDWMMPGIDGVEICRRLRQSTDPRMVYVIMVTTNAQPADLVEGLQAGADDYVTKPFDPQELHARLDVGVRVVELHQRLTERERSLAAARARLAHQARFESAVEAMSDGIVTTDGGWRITYANRAAELLLNMVDADYESRPLGDVLDPFTLSESTAALCASADETTDLEISRVGPGVKLWIDGRVTRIFDDQGDLTDAILTLRDATDRVNARNREMRFMNSISHKLRTPLTVIGGTLDVIRHLPPERMQETWDRLLPICRRQVRRLDETIQRLLDFRDYSITEPGADVEPVDPEAVTRDVEALLRDRYPDSEIEFDVTVDVEVEDALISADDLKLIVEELADNAVKFAEEQPVQVLVSIDRDDRGALRIRVEDHGPGIPHEYLDRVFEGYVQVEEVMTGQVRGVGLGLRIVRQVVEAYGGTVEIRSEIGAGTTVIAIIPSNNQPAP